MPRPALEIGETGTVRYTVRAAGGWTATARHCGDDGTVRPVSASGSSRGAALRALKTRIGQRRNPAAGAITPDTRLAELLAYWWETVAMATDSTFSDTTREAYERAIWTAAPALRPAGDDSRRRKHTAKVKRDKMPLAGLGGLKLRQCSVQGLSEFVAAVKKRHGYSAAHQLRVVLGHAFGVAASFGAVPFNVAKATPTVSRKAKEPVAHTRAEADRLLADLAGDPVAGRADLRDPIMMMLTTGLRSGECFGLRWVDVDLAAGTPTVTVHGTVTRTRAKGLHWQPRPKTASSARAIPVAPVAAAMLLARRVDSEASEGGYVFPAATGTLRDPGNARTALRDFGVRHPEWQQLIFTQQRKTAATWVRDAMGIEVASHLLGHTAVATTERHYAERIRRGPDVSAVFAHLLPSAPESISANENEE